MGSQCLEARRAATNVSQEEPGSFEAALHSRPPRILEAGNWYRFHTWIPGWWGCLGMTVGTGPDPDKCIEGRFGTEFYDQARE